MSHDRQRLVLEWAVDSFGECAARPKERAARLVEEAVEVAQALGLEDHVILRLVLRVYGRPPGELAQEIGGVGITLEALAENAGLNAEKCTQQEWERVMSKSKSWWQKKHAAKVKDGTADLESA